MLRDSIRELEIRLEAANREIEALKADNVDYKNRLSQAEDERRRLTRMLIKSL